MKNAIIQSIAIGLAITTVIAAILGVYFMAKGNLTISLLIVIAVCAVLSLIATIISVRGWRNTEKKYEWATRIHGWDLE